MNVYLTELRAICPKTGLLKTYAGPRIDAPTWRLAELDCEMHYPYLTVIGKLNLEIDDDDSETYWDFELN